MVKEFERKTMPGLPVLLCTVAGVVAAVICFVVAGRADSPVIGVLGALVLLGSMLFMAGLFSVAPGEARVLQLFGEYVGTARETGLRFANPFFTKKRVSVRVRNFESAKLKVNEKDGSPIEIAAIVVWKVVDTAEAVFEVDDYENYVHVQSESALRNLATQYPYDHHEGQDLSLRGSTNEIADKLKSEVKDRLAKAGVEVVEARISHLAYAPEIAGAMLRRQQASAIIAARTKIVEGAVGMVEMALQQLNQKQVVDLDNDRKAAMVSNLLVVLCGDHEATPVVNAGTIYQ
jgi:regulator of protease activity HflC (stomatin/prohibitin superfamily)